MASLVFSYHHSCRCPPLAVEPLLLLFTCIFSLFLFVVCLFVFAVNCFLPIRCFNFSFFDSFQLFSPIFLSLGVFFSLSLSALLIRVNCLALSVCAVCLCLCLHDLHRHVLLSDVAFRATERSHLSIHHHLFSPLSVALPCM